MTQIASVHCETCLVKPTNLYPLLLYIAGVYGLYQHANWRSNVDFTFGKKRRRLFSGSATHQDEDVAEQVDSRWLGEGGCCAGSVTGPTWRVTPSWAHPSQELFYFWSLVKRFRHKLRLSVCFERSVVRREESFFTFDLLSNVSDTSCVWVFVLSVPS